MRLFWAIGVYATAFTPATLRRDDDLALQRRRVLGRRLLGRLLGRRRLAAGLELGEVLGREDLLRLGLRDQCARRLLGLGRLRGAAGLGARVSRGLLGRLLGRRRLAAGLELGEVLGREDLLRLGLRDQCARRLLGLGRLRGAAGLGARVSRGLLGRLLGRRRLAAGLELREVLGREDLLRLGLRDGLLGLGLRDGLLGLGLRDGHRGARVSRRAAHGGLLGSLLCRGRLAAGLELGEVLGRERLLRLDARVRGLVGAERGRRRADGLLQLGVERREHLGREGEGHLS